MLEELSVWPNRAKTPIKRRVRWVLTVAWVVITVLYGGLVVVLLALGAWNYPVIAAVTVGLIGAYAITDWVAED